MVTYINGRILQQSKSAISTYLIVAGHVLDFQNLHGTNHRLHSHENVLEHKFDEASLVLIRVAAAVDDTHLLDECGLARLTSACVECEIDKVNSVFLVGEGHNMCSHKYDQLSLTEQQQLEFTAGIAFVAT